ncbi:MAG: bifunctional DNA primase/polymerase, partial [Ignavibacteriales bacterium]
MNRTNLDLALRYRQKLNWCIIPCNTRDKNPIILWKEYQKRLSEDQEIESWWTEYPDANLAVVVGNHSGIIAVDVDDVEYFRNKGFEIPPTPKALSGGGGEHYIFKYPDEGDKR